MIAYHPLRTTLHASELSTQQRPLLGHECLCRAEECRARKKRNLRSAGQSRSHGTGTLVCYGELPVCQLVWIADKRRRGLLWAHLLLECWVRRAESPRDTRRRRLVLASDAVHLIGILHWQCVAATNLTCDAHHACRGTLRCLARRWQREALLEDDCAARQTETMLRGKCHGTPRGRGYCLACNADSSRRYGWC